MNQHPAHRRDSEPLRLSAMIQSICEALPNCRSLRLVTATGIQHAWLHDGILSTPIAVGQVWELTGETADLGEYGEQFEIVAGQCTMPTGSLVIPYLHHHVPGLGMATLRRWWATFGEELSSVLARKDIAALRRSCQNHGGATVARLAVTIWTDQASYTEIYRELGTYGFEESVLRAAVKHYGDLSARMLHDDPYRLLAFSGFEKVDLSAKERYGVTTNDPRRLMGAVDAVLYELHDRGNAVVNREQLGTAAGNLAILTPPDACEAVHIAEKNGRIVAINSQDIIGEGNARIVDLVMDYLFRPKRSATQREADEKAMSLGERSPTLDRLVRHVLALHLAVLIAEVDTTAATIVRCFKRHFLAANEPYKIIAGTVELANRLRDDGVPEAVSLAQASDVVPLVAAHEPRTIIVVSSTIDCVAMARLLPRLHEDDRLVFVGKPLEFAGAGLPLLPLLLSANSVFRHACSEKICHENRIANRPVLDALRTERLDGVPYDPRNADRPGVFSIILNKSDLSRAAVGLCHQLRKHGTAALVIPPEWDKQQSLHLFNDLRELELAIGPNSVMLAGADKIEPGDFDSSIVILPGPLADNTQWLRTAAATARIRTVFVSARESNVSDCSQAQVNKSLPEDIFRYWLRRGPLTP
jgi:hypothetical protein